MIQPQGFMRILFLEDNLSFAESILFILNENGHTVDFTESTTHAIQLFDTHPYDAVISDIHLKSEASGMELIKHIRHKRKSNVTVIVTTGLDLIDENEIKKTRCGCISVQTAPHFLSPICLPHC